MSLPVMVGFFILPTTLLPTYYVSLFCTHFSFGYLVPTPFLSDHFSFGGRVKLEV